tara:strand:- start:7855 stop:8298 length:444 start_codon:yes stop_codon:yes gene_type:complete
MEFPQDIWREIFSYFHSSYKKPVHLECFKNIKVYQKYHELSKNVMYQEEQDNPELYMHSSLYRFMMDDYTFMFPDCNLEEKWNPYMANYCNNYITYRGEELDYGFDDKMRHKNLWSIDYDNYKKELLSDFINVLDHVRYIESYPWWA